MKKLIILLLCLILTAGTARAEEITRPDGDMPYTDFVFLSTTDMHGKCWDTNLLTGSSAKNNMLRVSTAVRTIREEYGADHVLLVDNGDLFQGTPVSQVQLFLRAAGKSEDPLAMALCLKEIGYDAFVLGNHEFNYPWKVMSETYRWLEENGVPVLAANAVWDGSDPEHTAGENVFIPYIVKTVTVNGHPHKIGLLGLENGDITRWDLPDNYPGIRFAHPENEAYSSAYEASLYIAQMKGEGCEFIAISYHGGIGESDLPLAFGVNSEHQGKRIAEEADGVDLMIVGHDHLTGYTNTFVTGPSGKQILVVNGGGQELTKSVFRFSEDENGALQWELFSAENISPVGFDIDPELEAKIRPYAELAEAEVESPAGIAGGEWDGSNEFYTRQTDSADLVCAAMMYAGSAGMTARYGEPEQEALKETIGIDHLDVDMAMSSVASTGYTIQSGDISMKNIYRLYRYANSLLVLPMYGRDIRAIMEENAENWLTVRVINGQAFYFAKDDMFTNIVFGGINFDYDMSRPAGERVTIRGFSNGRSFEEDALYLVVTNNYILGNEHCGLRTFGFTDTLWSQQEEEGDRMIQDAIADYIIQVTEEKGAVIPEEEFNWHWEIVYSADPAALPEYEGKIVARMIGRPEDGQACILYSESQGRAMTAREINGTLDQVPVAAWGETLVDDLPEEALILTAHVDGEGRIALTDPEGRYLTSGKTGGLKLSEGPAEDELSLWCLEEAPGGWYIVNAGAPDSMAIEYYSDRFTTFRLERNGIYTFNFYTPVD